MSDYFARGWSMSRVDRVTWVAIKPGREPMYAPTLKQLRALVEHVETGW